MSKKYPPVSTKQFAKCAIHISLSKGIMLNHYGLRWCVLVNAFGLFTAKAEFMSQGVCFIWFCPHRFLSSLQSSQSLQFAVKMLDL